MSFQPVSMSQLSEIISGSKLVPSASYALSSPAGTNYWTGSGVDIHRFGNVKISGSLIITGSIYNLTLQQNETPDARVVWTGVSKGGLLQWQTGSVDSASYAVTASHLNANMGGITEVKTFTDAGAQTHTVTIVNGVIKSWTIL